jgi:hypothetical protein
MAESLAQGTGELGAAPDEIVTAGRQSCGRWAGEKTITRFGSAIFTKTDLYQRVNPFTLHKPRLMKIGKAGVNEVSPETFLV